MVLMDDDDGNVMWSYVDTLSMDERVISRD